MLEVAAFVGALAAFVTACGVLWQKVVKPGWKLMKRTQDIWETLVTIEERSRQLVPNHGSHLNDDVKEIRKILETQEDVLKAHIADSHAREADIWRAIAENNSRRESDRNC